MPVLHFIKFRRAVSRSSVAADARFNAQENGVMQGFDAVQFLFTGLYKLVLLEKNDYLGKKELSDMGLPQVNFRHYYSPIFGRALEVNLIPSKVCSFDCIYCKYGKTTQKTINLIQPESTKKTIGELKKALSKDHGLDYIVFSGNGDPLLHNELPLILAELKKITRIKVAVVSCGGLLWRQKAQADLSNADIVMASLDSADKAMYHYVNRPHDLVPYSRFLEGMIEFRRTFRGSFWLQVTLLDGINADEAEVNKLSKLVDFLNPDQTFIRTLPGKPVEDFVHPVEHSRLQNFARLFGSRPVIIDCEEVPVHSAAAHDGLPLGVHD